LYAPIASSRSPALTSANRAGLLAGAARWLWPLTAVGFALLCSGRSMLPAWLAPVPHLQDDARQHTFWMARFRDPGLFPGDVIADLFQALAPPGYTALYWLFSRFGDPIQATWFVPPVLGALTALATYALVRRIHPSRSAALLASTLHSWYLWQYDDLVSATPRAFLPPILTALLWALAGAQRWIAVGLVGLGGLLYPTTALLGVALMTIRLLTIKDWRIGLSRDRRDWLAALAAVLLTLATLLPGEVAANRSGASFSAAEARRMPDFGPQGRTSFFLDRPYEYWIESERSGFDLRVTDRIFRRVPILAEYLALGALLLVLLSVRRWLPAVRQLRPAAVVLPQLLAVSLGLFILAHLTLFQLYLPSRFVKWSVPLVLAVAGGLALGMLIETAAARTRLGRFGAAGASALTLALLLGLALYPARYNGLFSPDPRPAISAFLRTQPPDVLVAGASSETDAVPAFAARSVLVSREHMVFLRRDYYLELRERTRRLVAAYYTDSLPELADFTRQSGVDFILVNRRAFSRSSFQEVWTGHPEGRWEPFTSLVRERLRGGQRFVLPELARSCALLDDGQVAVVPTTCIEARLSQP
jgi:hypothetical protein